MFTTGLKTSNPAVALVKPDPERDAPLGVAWLAGAEGRRTLKLMGVADELNQESTIEQERARIQAFLDGEDQYNWMISYHGRIVGAVWVDLKPTKHIPAPTVSIMIGNPSARGHGVGKAALAAVIDYLGALGQPELHARHLLTNQASHALLTALKFTPNGPPYSDSDGLTWQNLALRPKNSMASSST